MDMNLLQDFDYPDQPRNSLEYQKSHLNFQNYKTQRKYKYL